MPRPNLSKCLQLRLCHRQIYIYRLMNCACTMYASYSPLLQRWGRSAHQLYGVLSHPLLWCIRSYTKNHADRHGEAN